MEHPVQGIGGVRDIDLPIGIGIDARQAGRRPAGAEQPAQNEADIGYVHTPVTVCICTHEWAYLVAGISHPISIEILLGRVRIARAIVAAIRDPVPILIGSVVPAGAGVRPVAHSIIVIIWVTGITHAISFEFFLR